jgi:hypothetical protein
MNKQKHMKIRFIKSAAPIGLGYGIGSEADLPQAQASELIETGFAEACEEIKTADEVKPAALKKAVKK